MRRLRPRLCGSCPPWAAPLVALFGVAALAGCSEDPTCAPRVITSDTACDTAQSCVDAGFQGLTCIDGFCRKPCQTDAECVLDLTDLEEPEICQQMATAVAVAVCEAQVCEVGCPDAPCGAGETCVSGRCTYYSEGFEIPEGEDVADLGRKGFNGLDTELTNRKTGIVWEGVRGCTLGDTTCAGPAAEGERFLSLQRQATQAKGTAETDFTCRPCACCLECLFQPAGSPPVQLSSCPTERPSPLVCPTSTPARCQSVCDQCDQCPDANPARIGERLTSCERATAVKTCSSCMTCDADKAACTSATCPACASEPNGSACVECVRANCQGSAACRSCFVCEDANDCLVSDPGSAACLQNVADCQALGADGCFDAAVGYRRAQLEPTEQALISPAVDLSGASGQVVLQLDHVPFNVAETFRPGIQGTDPALWPVAPQQVEIGLCGGNCEDEGAWQVGAFADGAPAIIPAANRRRNGLLLGSQTVLDWRAGQIRVVIPDALRTPTFRFRLLPNIDADTRVGVDGVAIRRLP